MGSRKFELPELKLLVDAVQSSKFITVKKSRKLIKKLESLASVSEAKQLQRNVYICLLYTSFCCISTGEFHFPNEEAAEIAVETVREVLREHPELMVVFNVFQDRDREIYERLLKR